MSAPETNVKKQERRHKVPLMGMVWSIVWAAVLFVGLILWLSLRGNEPGNDTPIEAEGGGEAAATASE